MTETKESSYKYYAFISYSSKDIRHAEDLQEFLQNIKIPTIIREEYKLPETVTPIYRDVTDIKIAQLKDILRDELERSKYLIIICSPNSAQSAWVNREVEYFIELGRYDRIIPYIISGTPGGGAQECFPPILRKPPVYWDNPNLDLTVEKNRVTNERIKRNLAAILADKEQLNGASLEKEGEEYAFYRILSKLLGVEMRVFTEQDEIAAEIRQKRLLRREAEKMKKQLFWKRVGWLFGGILSVQILIVAILSSSKKTNEAPNEAPLEYIYYSNIDFSRGNPEPIGKDKLKTPQNNCYRSIKQPGILKWEYGNFTNKSSIIKANDKYGVATYNFDWNEKNTDLRRGDYSDKVGDKCLFDQKIAWWKIEQINIGYRIQFFDASDRVVEEIDLNDRKKPFKIRCYTYDAYGRQKKNETHTQIGDKSYTARHYSSYDRYGNETSREYVDMDGKPCLGNDGYAKVHRHYDERGNETKREYFGVDGKPCLSNEQIAGWRSTYDERGNRTEVEYFGMDGKPCLGNDGYAKVHLHYDVRGNITKEAYFGVDGKPCLSNDGYAVVRRTYDERGNITEEAYFGVDGKPCLSNDGYAVVRMTYDDRGNITEEAYFGVDGKPCLIDDGYAGWRRTYDERGNITEQAYFGVDGKPAGIEDGHTRIQFEYDPEGKKTAEIKYYELAPHKNGYQKIKWTYDTQGNITEEAYFGVDGKPCLSNEQIAGWRKTYDDHGKITEQAYFGVDGMPCLNKHGYASYHSTYDERGNITEEAYFGVDGKPCEYSEGTVKASIIRTFYSSNGIKTAVEYLRLDGSGIRERYDADGEIVSQEEIPAPEVKKDSDPSDAAE